ncbi:MAG: DUF3298 and DUF4163 domain-containing protein [Clostridia bacterium]|jgi:hypothetical protein|nr:DUF3298 and DUF4163 domain-containing protein [Clostridia bacterium]
MKKKVKLLTYVLVVVTLGSLLIACSANKAVVKDQEEKANIVEKTSFTTSTEDKKGKKTEKEGKKEEERKEKIKISLNEKVIKEDTEAITIDIRYPIISGHPDRTIEAKLNSSFEEKVIGLKDMMQKGAVEALQYSKENDVEFQKYMAQSSFKERYNKNGFLSLTISTFEFMGGSEGIRATTAYNIDIGSGKVYQLHEIFAENCDFKKIIDEVMLNTMKENEDKYFQGVIDDFQGISGDQPFYIEDGNLVVYFGVYQLGPISTGEPEFKVPLSKFEFKEGLGINE